MTSQTEESDPKPPAYDTLYQGQTVPGYPKQEYPQQPTYPRQAYSQQPYPATQYAWQPGPQPYTGQTTQAGGQPGVVTQQPAIVNQIQTINPPPDHMGYSVCVTFCCCWLIGIFAIMKSSECRNAIARGDQALAVQKSGEAKKIANIALGLGICSIFVTFTIMGIYYGLIWRHVY